MSPAGPHAQEQPDPRAGPGGDGRVLGPRWRWVLLYWVAQALAASGAGLLLTWESAGGWADARETAGKAWYWAFLGVIVGGIMLCQATVLMPLRRPLATRPTWGRALRRHAVAGLALAWLVGWVAYLGGVGIAELTGAERIRPWWPGSFAMIGGGTWVLITLVLTCAYGRRTPALASYAVASSAAGALVLGAVLGLKEIADGLGARTDGGAFYGLVSAGVGLLSWGVGTPLLMAYARGRARSTVLSRIAARLFAGTAIEAGVLLPIDVMVRRKSDCYCAEGTFYAWILCLSAGFFALGPLVFLLPFQQTRRRRRRFRCGACGYDMSGCLAAERCPECGRVWKRPPTPDL